MVCILKIKVRGSLFQPNAGNFEKFNCIAFVNLQKKTMFFYEQHEFNCDSLII